LEEAVKLEKSGAQFSVLLHLQNLWRGFESRLADAFLPFRVLSYICIFLKKTTVHGSNCFVLKPARSSFLF
jgi:hypothetical protein